MTMPFALDDVAKVENITNLLEKLRVLQRNRVEKSGVIFGARQRRLEKPFRFVRMGDAFRRRKPTFRRRKGGSAIDLGADGSQV
jgi:hypothetical protein